MTGTWQKFRYHTRWHFIRRAYTTGRILTACGKQLSGFDLIKNPRISTRCKICEQTGLIRSLAKGDLFIHALGVQS